MTAPQELTVREVAAMLGCSTSTVYRLLRRDELQFIPGSDPLRIRRESVDAYNERRAREQPDD